MKKAMQNASFLLSLFGLLTSGLLAETYRFRSHGTLEINGVKLKPGAYKLRLDGNSEAEIWEFALKAPVQVLPLGVATPNSILHEKSGRFMEVRLQGKRIVFLELSAQKSDIP